MTRESVSAADLKTPTNNKYRARRFAFRSPLRYRMQGEDRWLRGETRNMSASGVLFRGEHPVKPDTSLELCLAMPVSSPEGAVKMVCQCIAVRAADDPQADGVPVVAAKIVYRRWVRP
jgi:hypothetical protein